MKDLHSDAARMHHITTIATSNQTTPVMILKPRWSNQRQFKQRATMKAAILQSLN